MLTRLKRPFLGCLFLSLVLHGGLFVAFDQVAGDKWRAKEEQVEIFIREKPPQKRMYIKDLEMGKPVDRPKKKAHLLSQTTRRVRSQTVARHSGKDQNARPSKKSPTQRLPVTSKKTSLTSPQTQQVYLGFTDSQLPSSISTYHPHIKVADITALNVDKGLLEYYTFYIRMHEQLSSHWFQLLKEVIHHTSTSTLSRMGRVPRVTQLEVILDSDGKYMGSIVVDSSQERVLDMAAKESFKSAAPFVNPPQDMVEEDGYIYLPFSFRVEFNAPRLTRSRRSKL